MVPVKNAASHIPGAAPVLLVTNCGTVQKAGGEGVGTGVGTGVGAGVGTGVGRGVGFGVGPGGEVGTGV